MATIEHTREPVVAKVDTLVDENGNKIDVPDDTALKIATDVEQVTGRDRADQLVAPEPHWHRHCRGDLAGAADAERQYGD